MCVLEKPDGAESAFTDGRGVNPAQGLRLGRTN